jgi:hypothetical protein
MEKPQPREQTKNEYGITHANEEEREIRFLAPKEESKDLAEFGQLYNGYRKPGRHILIVSSAYSYDEVYAWIKTLGQPPKIEETANTNTDGLVIEDEKEKEEAIPDF